MSGVRYFTVASLPVDGPDNTLLIILILVSVLGLVGFISVIVALKRVRKPSEIIETRETRLKKPKKKKSKISKTKWQDQQFICPFCQNALPMRQKFCTYCGTNLQEENQ
jgi:Trk-type K+ transport system membrane component